MDHSVLLAVNGNSVLAVGAVTDDGEITLCYVSPTVRFQGVSRALLRALEMRAIDCGNTRSAQHQRDCSAILSFGWSAGYTDDGPPIQMFGTPTYPSLTEPSSVYPIKSKT